jgi:hypothetical protein
MTFDETTNEQETEAIEKVPIVDAANEPAKNAEEIINKPGEESELKSDEVKAEPQKDEDNSVIRNMRKQIKAQQREMAELRKAIQQPAEIIPQRESFETDADYINAQVDYRLKQSQIAQPQINPLQQKFEEVRKNHPDFDEALTDIDHVRFSSEAQKALNEAMVALPYGSDVLYHIAKNPDLAEEISILPASVLAVKLGEIHADIRREKTKKPQVSKAPTPIKPVAGSSTPVKNYDDMTDEEFMATRRKERIAHKMRFA